MFANVKMEPEILDAYSGQILHFSHIHHQNIYYDNYSFIPLPPTPPSPNLYQEANIFNHQFIPANQRTYYYENCQLPSFPLKSAFNRSLHSEEVSSHPFNNDTSSSDEPSLLFPSSQDFETSSAKVQDNHEENSAMEYFAERLFNSKHEDSINVATTHSSYEEHTCQNQEDVDRQMKIKFPHNQIEDCWNTSLGIEDVQGGITATEDCHQQCVLSIESPFESDDIGE